MDEETKHEKKMKRIKEVKDRLYEDADKEKGLLAVHTGTGKGKTTAAMGMVVRCLGHGMDVGIVQYVKGTRDTAEEVVFVENFDSQVDFYRMGEGFTWETQDRETDREAAEAAWNQSKTMIQSGDYDFVLLDELNIVLSDDLLDLDEVLDVLENKPDDLHVVVTGRRAKQDLIQLADLATEMRLVKHPFQDQGVKAQPGIEY
ncbi:MAG: cob(I)yrinic acid a,c-diamide adenosyltransferase [bacterium]